MAAHIRFDGLVALVTGAGGGLGREYALAFAERGASVVVNDLGGDIHGSGKSRAADKVVNEINNKGGKAVANYDSVEDGDKVVQTALDNFGRIDIVVNNAGILRDKSFARTSDQDWDLIHKVHLKGCFLVTRAAWPHMKKQNFGRIIMTTSAAGIYGNFGQANYSSAKLGIFGLSNTLAIEGEKNNIRCNAIAPMAGSRLTETVMPPDFVEALKPVYVMPLVLYLCDKNCEETGGLFEVGAGWMAKLRWERTKGAVVRRKAIPITPEDVRENWEKITDFTDSDNPKTVEDSTVFMMNLVKQIDSGSIKNNNCATDAVQMDPALAMSFNFNPSMFSYGERDVILYALGIGISSREEHCLNFLHESSAEFCVFPTYAVIPCFEAVTASFSVPVPGFIVDPIQVLHGEQYLELFKPIPTMGTLKSKMKIADIVDKGRGALVIYNIETFDENQEKVAFNQLSIYVTGAGNFNGKRTSDVAVPTVTAPKRSPDAIITEKTSIDQAALYRLSGDTNPLHINPMFAAAAGFETPILHGLCSFGFAVRHVMRQFANDDVSKFKSVKVRFSKPVLPGQTVKTSMWKEGKRIHFTTKIVENDNVCITGAYVDLKEVTTPEVKQVPNDLQCTKVFEELDRVIKSRPGLSSETNAIFQWNITKDGDQVSQWTVDLKTSKSGLVYQGIPVKSKPDCILTIEDSHLAKLDSGKLTIPVAFFTGKLKIKGNMKLFQKLKNLFQEKSKL